MRSEVVSSFMAQFVSGIDIVQQKEVISTASYLMALTRISMSTFVSFKR